MITLGISDLSINDTSPAGASVPFVSLTARRSLVRHPLSEHVSVLNTLSVYHSQVYGQVSIHLLGCAGDDSERISYQAYAMRLHIQFVSGSEVDSRSKPVRRITARCKRLNDCSIEI